MRSPRRNTPATVSDPTASHPRTNVRRRGFLLALGAGGAGAAALAARSLSRVAPQDTSSATDDSKGYQVTDHVKRYYRTAKI
jgi:ferric-dicitrate binding protein FerR (iron transport regulator)